ncbi:MAG: T9SS type A sorting domain-containing protein [candidate division Zixibacteria bacterium]|nr:T9SS type A sorting domain-containing protein [candidate division Zixibacteria bacterium]
MMKRAILLVLCTLFANGVSADVLVSPDGENEIQYHQVEKGLTVEDIVPGMALDFEQYDIDPGIAPEGDYTGWMTFTPDGQRVLVTNRMTENVTVMDAETMEVLTNFHVGYYPAGIAATNDKAVVTCAFADSVYIIDLDDYSIAAGFETGEQPWVARITPDENYALVSCDIDDVCEVINLNTLTHEGTIQNFPVWLMSWSFNSENGRNGFEFSGFEVLPDNQHIIVTDGETNVLIIDIFTGDVVETIPDIIDGRAVALSGDGAKAVVACYGTPMKAYQIDLMTYEVTGTVEVTGYGLGRNGLAVNQDGSKAYVGTSNNTSAILRFDTSDFIIFTDTYTAFWIGVSPDHSMAISGQYRFSIIDFETESIIGQYFGNSQNLGAVSPVGTYAAGADPHRHEGLYFYDYTDGFPDYLGTTEAGLSPEGDAPRRVAVAPDGSKAVVSNVLSDNVTILNLDTYEIEAILPVGDRVQNVQITSDSRYAVVCGFNSNSVPVIDLNINEIVADVPAGARAGVVSITPDDRYAYVGNISANTVSIIELDGENSSEINEISCGVIGVVWAGMGVSSDVECSPDGGYALVAASFDDVVHVIDTDDMEIVASLPTGDFPIQLAFNADGQYAIATNYFDDSFTLMGIDGGNSWVVGNFPVGDAPLRVAYNEVTDEFGVGLYSDKVLVNVDPQTGDIISRDYYTQYGSLLQVDFDEEGEPMILTMSDGSTPGHLHRGSEVIGLPATPTYFDYTSSGGIVAVAMPGPDYVTVIDWQQTGITDTRNIDISLPGNYLIARAYPNPFNPQTTLDYYAPADGEIKLAIYNVNGQLVDIAVEGFVSAGMHSVTWDGGAMPSGIYFARLTAGDRTATKKIVLMK